MRLISNNFPVEAILYNNGQWDQKDGYVYYLYCITDYTVDIDTIATVE